MWLLEAASGLSRSELIADGSDLGDDVRGRALALAGRRAAGEPLQYVTGRAAFRYLELGVGPGVFIPRPETELVAERAMELLPPGGTVVDVGTGSGAIALSIAQERPDARVLATESSRAALAYAVRNAERLPAPVELFHGDLLDALPRRRRGSIDVCVSNPPYVAWDERRVLPGDVVDHEAHDELFAPGEGLAITERLARSAHAWVRSGGWLVVEVADRRGTAVAGMLAGLGYRSVEVDTDLTGRERIVQGRV